LFSGDDRSATNRGFTTTSILRVMARYMVTVLVVVSAMVFVVSWQWSGSGLGTDLGDGPVAFPAPLRQDQARAGAADL
jgi:hypothetical protein